MAKINEYGSAKTILKYFPFKAAACVVPASMATGGSTVVPAGTPFPANDATCLGLLLHDVDVSDGDTAGTYVYEGVIDVAKLNAAGVSVAKAARDAMPNVQFYANPYGATTLIPSLVITTVGASMMTD